MRFGIICFYFFIHKCVNLFVNVIVTALNKGLTEHCGAAVINLAKF